MTAFNDGKRLVDILDGATTELLTSTIDANRWVLNIRQTPQFSSSRPQPASSGTGLTLFRAGMVDNSEKLHKDLEQYLGKLNDVNAQAEGRLAKCSTFTDNCARFENWLSSIEDEWKIPQVDGLDTVSLDEEQFLWEKQALATTYKVGAQFIKSF